MLRDDAPRQEADDLNTDRNMKAIFRMTIITPFRPC